MNKVRILVIVEERPGVEAFGDIDISHLFENKQSDTDLNELLALNVNLAKEYAEDQLRQAKTGRQHD